MAVDLSPRPGARDRDQLEIAGGQFVAAAVDLSPRPPQVPPPPSVA